MIFFIRVLSFSLRQPSSIPGCLFGKHYTFFSIKNQRIQQTLTRIISLILKYLRKKQKQAGSDSVNPI